MDVPAMFVEMVSGGAVTVGWVLGQVEYAQLCVITDTEDIVMGWTTVVEEPDTQMHATGLSGVASWYTHFMPEAAVVVFRYGAALAVF